jgi:hypothetical protein
MPELPEVETVRRGLAPSMEGARITGAELRRPDLRFPLPTDFSGRLVGRKVAALSRRGKYLLADLDDGTVLVMHLGMSGSFRVEAQDDVAPGLFHHARSRAAAHDHVVLHLEGASGVARIIYNDPRRFGFMDLVARNGIENSRHFAGMGIEPLGNSLDGPVLAALFEGKSAPIKAALLDQRLLHAGEAPGLREGRGEEGDVVGPEERVLVLEHDHEQLAHLRLVRLHRAHDLRHLEQRGAGMLSCSNLLHAGTRKPVQSESFVWMIMPPF